MYRYIHLNSRTNVYFIILVSIVEQHSDMLFTGMIVFSYLTDQLFSSDKHILIVAGHGQNISRKDLLKVGVDGFNYFHSLRANPLSRSPGEVKLDSDQ